MDSSHLGEMMRYDRGISGVRVGAFIGRSLSIASGAQAVRSIDRKSVV